ncbi:g11182 [Coccomyxa elongata]
MPLNSWCAAIFRAAIILLLLAKLGQCQPDLYNFKDGIQQALKDCKLCNKFVNFAANQSVTGPTQAFLDHYAAVISAQLLLTEKSPAKALLAATQLFDSARQYTRTIAANKTAQPNIVTAIANSDFYALNQLIGTRLAEYLPDHIGLDRFKYNYTQGVLPGLTTALTGFSYAPCLFSSSAVGAVAGVTGIGIAPKVFNYGPSAGAVVAQGIAVSPSLLYINQGGSAGIAIGTNISPSLITIAPSKHIRARVGVAASKSGISVSFAAAPGPAPAAAPAPAPGPGPGSSASEPQGTP